MTDPDIAVRLRGVRRTYEPMAVTALNDVDLTIASGEFVAILGPSGSGKSTLLNMIGTLDRPTGGSVEIDGHDTTQMNDRQLSRLRGHRIGFVFQQFHLTAGVSAIDNVANGMVYLGIDRRSRRRLSETALERVGLAKRMQHKPHQLSGGERQRVAIARAIAHTPSILLADEPTGNLDSTNGEHVMNLFDSLHSDGTTIVLITHDQSIAEQIPRQVTIKDGSIMTDSARKGTSHAIDAVR